MKWFLFLIFLISVSTKAITPSEFEVIRNLACDPRTSVHGYSTTSEGAVWSIACPTPEPTPIPTPLSTGVPASPIPNPLPEVSLGVGYDSENPTGPILYRTWDFDGPSRILEYFCLEECDFSGLSPIVYEGIRYGDFHTLNPTSGFYMIIVEIYDEFGNSRFSEPKFLTVP